MCEPGYSPQSLELSKKKKKGQRSVARRGGERGEREYEHDIKRSAVTCCVEILLVHSWVKGRGRLDGFGAAGAFGRDGLVVGVARA